MTNPKIFVVGYGRHGKDTVCEMLRDMYGLTFGASSWVMAERLMLPYFNSHPHLPSYQSVEECFNDRHGISSYKDDYGQPLIAEHRAVWYNQIKAFNDENGLSALGRIIADKFDIYAGIRNHEELQACLDEGVYETAVWVDRSAHMPPEDVSSCTVTRDMAEYVIDNNGSLDDLRVNVQKFWDEFTAER